MEETLLGVYGADGWRGAAKERIKLQSELDRARDQVLPSSIPTPPPPPSMPDALILLCSPFCSVLLFLAAETSVVVFVICPSCTCLFACLLSRVFKKPLR